MYIKYRILSVLLALTVAFSALFPISAAAAADDAVYEALDILQFLNIVEKDYEKSTFDYQSKVSRAEFAVYLYRLLNKEGQAGFGLCYNDVSVNHYAYNEITVLTQSGYMYGVEEKRFEPDALMEKEHAYSALLNAMGYGMYIESKGLSAAAVYSGISKDVSSEKTLVLGDLLIMMKNALTGKCFEVTVISNGNQELEQTENTLLFNTRHMRFEKNGYVSAADGVSTNGGAVEDDEVVIGDKSYHSVLEDALNYIGCTVSFIYSEEKNEQPELLWIKKKANDGVLEIYVDGDGSFNKAASELTYFSAGGSEKRVKLPVNMNVIYNGEFYTGKVSDILDKERYELTLFKNAGGSYTLAVIWAYENIIVASKDEKEMLVYDKIGKRPCSFASDIREKVSLGMNDGTKIELSDLRENDCVSIFESADGSRIKAVAARSSISGTIQSKSSGKGIKIDGKWYKCYSKAYSDIFDSAKSAALYLDFKGYIAYAVPGFNAENQYVGYAYSGGIKRDEIDPKIKLKLLGESGVTDTVELTEKVRIDGSRRDNISDVFSMLADESGKFKPQLLLFKKSADGEIRDIYRASDNGGDDKHLIRTVTCVGDNKWWARAYSGPGLIGVSMLYDDKTKLFCVPEDDRAAIAGDSEFKVTKPQHGEFYLNCVGYKITTEEVFCEQYIVYKGELNTSPEGTFFLLDEVFSGLNAEGDVVKYMSGMQAGAAAEYEIDTDYYDLDAADLGSGDLMRLALYNGKVIGAVKYYDYDNPSAVSIGRDYGETEQRFVSGYVNARSGSLVKIGYTDEKTADSVTNLKGCEESVMIYDPSRNGSKLYKGTVEEIRDYKSCGHGSFIVIHTQTNNIRSVVLYK